MDLVLPQPFPIFEAMRRTLRGIGIFLAGFSDAVEKKVLEHIVGKTTYTVTAPTYLALVTVAVIEGDTAGTLTEATYTGYARKSVAAADWNTAGGGATSAITNANAITFAACTAGTSTVIGWALCSSSSGAGDVIMFGTCTSVVISSTQTPATIAISALSLGLD